MFLLHQLKALDDSVPTVSVLVDVWVPILTPNQWISHHDPAIASSISFCYVLIKNVQHHQPKPPGAETIPLIICLWFVLSVCMDSAPGVVGWWHGTVLWQHNTMSNQHKEGCIGKHWGAIFTSSKHLLTLPLQKNIVHVHSFNLVLRWV